MNTNKTEDIMKYESILPADFDGTFRFTNWSDEDFVGKWGGQEYHFPAGTTSPIIMSSQTPLEIQQIRKKFAKALAEREFFKSKEYSTKYISQERNPDGSPRLNGIQQAGTYSLDTLAPLIQKCLAPLPISKVIVREARTEPLEDKLTRNDDGELNSIAVDKGASKDDLKRSFKKKALEA